MYIFFDSDIKITAMHHIDKYAQSIIMCEVHAMLEHCQRHTNLTNFVRAKRPFCRRCEMICFTSSLIKQLYHFATDFDRLLLQLVTL